MGCILDLGTLMHRLSSEEGLSSVHQGGWQVVSYMDRLFCTSSLGRVAGTELQFSWLSQHKLKNIWCSCYSNIQKNHCLVEVLVEVQRSEVGRGKQGENDIHNLEKKCRERRWEKKWEELEGLSWRFRW